MLVRLKKWFSGPREDGLAKRYRRRQKAYERVYQILPFLRIILYVAGFAWMLLLPSSLLGRRIYIDENALQPAQVNTYWSWDDVHIADRYLEQLETLHLSNASSSERAQFLRRQFLAEGLPSATQSYTFDSSVRSSTGVNTYAVYSAPRTAGTEAMVIAASWTSINGDPNLRGIATVLALARYLKRYSLWAKDLVFVISDGHLEGMQAWLSAYHGIDQSNLHAQPLSLSSGVIWTALAIDYPGHSFSHLGIFYEGLNGRLPNQDLMNSVNVISSHTGRVPVIVYDKPDEVLKDSMKQSLSTIPFSEEMVNYLVRAQRMLRHFQCQYAGRPSGIHGLFHPYRIDAITLFAVPATGPHGFHALGRIVESSLRTMNNLLERLHASFFFYILSSANSFLKIGEYLPSVIMISAAVMFGGLRLWVDAGWVQDSSRVTSEKDSITIAKKLKTRRRNVFLPLGVIVATHIFGGFMFLIATSSWFSNLNFTKTSYLPIIPASLIVLSCLSSLLTSEDSSNGHTAAAPLHLLLKSFNLCLTSTVISVTSVLNFSLAAYLAILLGIPLSLSSPTKKLPLKVTKALAYFTILFPIYQILFTKPISPVLLEWQLLGVWHAPFMFIVYLPLVLQAMLVCMLDV